MVNEIEIQKLLLDTVIREWDFIHDAIKTILSLLVITTPIYISGLGLLLSFMNLRESYLTWIICLIFIIYLIALLAFAFNCYTKYISERIKSISKVAAEFRINDLMRNVSIKFDEARKALREIIILYMVLNIVYITVINWLMSLTMI